jgi:hypothetical protein
MQFASLGLVLLAFPVQPSTSSMVLTDHDDMQLELDQMACTRHKFLHLSWVTIDLIFDVNFCKFVCSIDPLRDFLSQQCLSLSDFFCSQFTPSTLPCFASSCASSLLQTSTLFNVLLQDTTSDSTPPIDPTDMPIVVDTGASVSLTPVLSDFTGPLVPTQLTELKGLTAKTHVIGKGFVKWPIRDFWNVPGVIKTSAYYVPNASIRLFSPHCYFQENDNQGRCVIQGCKATMKLPEKTILEFPYNPGNNLPLLLTEEPVPVSLRRPEVDFFATNFSTLLLE